MSAAISQEHMEKYYKEFKKRCSSKHYHGSGVPLYFLPASPNIIPVGIVDDANHFEWRKPDGTTWKIENVADLEVFTYHEEYSQSESALVGLLMITMINTLTIHCLFSS